MWGLAYTSCLAADKDENDQWQAANQYGRVDKVLNLSVFTTMTTWDHEHQQHWLSLRDRRGAKRNWDEENIAIHVCRYDL